MLVYVQIWDRNHWATPLTPRLTRFEFPLTPELREKVENAAHKARLVRSDTDEVI